MAQTEGNRKPKSTAELPEIPDKLYFRIGEVARLLDLPTYVLRFWETEFPQLKPNKGGTGQRLYRKRDVEMALRIRVLLYDEGYTIPGARQFLKGEVRATEPRLPLRAAPQDEAAVSTVQLRRVKSELREIATLLAQPSPGGRRLPNPAHRGLHMASDSRRRASTQPPATSPLFPVDPAGAIDVLGDEAPKA